MQRCTAPAPPSIDPVEQRFLLTTPETTREARARAVHLCKRVLFSQERRSQRMKVEPLQLGPFERLDCVIEVESIDVIRSSGHGSSDFPCELYNFAISPPGCGRRKKGLNLRVGPFLISGPRRSLLAAYAARLRRINTAITPRKRSAH